MTNKLFYTDLGVSAEIISDTSLVVTEKDAIIPNPDALNNDHAADPIPPISNSVHRCLSCETKSLVGEDEFTNDSIPTLVDPQESDVEDFESQFPQESDFDSSL
jgi:hypothetical protein